MTQTPEHKRLDRANRGKEPWRLFGAYVSERQWGTVREDYSPDGSAWTYFPHDHARSRAYRWGEDGLGGFSDRNQRLCMGVALWNGKDPILKERLFGLTGIEGNHAEDVKELYYYLDATPTHSYLKMLYKYPHAAYPYDQLVAENARRGKGDREYELLDTGVFEGDRYCDVFIEYAKAGPSDILMRVTAHNRGPEPTTLHVLPQVWFRNQWSWGYEAPAATLQMRSKRSIAVHHDELGDFTASFDSVVAPLELLFTDNHTNAPRIFGKPGEGYFKDAFHERVIHGREDAVNPEHAGTKAAGWYALEIPPGESRVVRMRLTPGTSPRAPFKRFDDVFTKRIAEADAFYDDVQQNLACDDSKRVQRQAFAGMIWSEQYYGYDVSQWLAGDPCCPDPPPQRLHGRNSDWTHLNNGEIISMPDKWEYPWYAAWDLAFHCVPLAMIDPQFAKDQLVLMTREWYMHPNGQLPAYEWAFGDVNPPVHAWAALKVYEIDMKQSGKGDVEFLERIFHKLLLNFTWWVNRKDVEGRNVFQGGFLGMDNIGVFDRSTQLPTGGYINQADGTAWMAMYCLNLLRMSLELAQHNNVYEDTATKFYEHFLYIAAAMNNIGGDLDRRGVALWSEEDEFFYDVLSLPDGTRMPLKLRSMVGLTPLFAVEVLDDSVLDKLPEFTERLRWFLKNKPELATLVSRWHEPGAGETHLLSLLRGHRMKCLLRRMLDETQFLSDFGVRSLSREYKDTPYELHVNGSSFSVRYTPAESNTEIFGGNSNWRGPIWMPVNFMLIDALRRFHHYYGDDFRVECPTGSGTYLSINQIADELSRRLSAIFLRDAQGRRPVFNGSPVEQGDARFRDMPLFYEYFDGDTGRGVGASHQTGWTGLVAALLDPTFGELPC